jgi:hypothetical protein
MQFGILETRTGLLVDSPRTYRVAGKIAEHVDLAVATASRRQPLGRARVAFKGWKFVHDVPKNCELAMLGRVASVATRDRFPFAPRLLWASLNDLGPVAQQISLIWINYHHELSGAPGIAMQAFFKETFASDAPSASVQSFR